MNPSQIEKIKLLVNSSAMLSAPEKAEWLALLGLMNDRQLGELEKILTATGKKQDPRNKTQGELQPLTKTAPVTTPPVQTKLPPLSHIVNLPKNFAAPRVPQKMDTQQGVTPEALAKRILEAKPEQKTISGRETFAAKLKSIFSEKELPAGIKTQNLELLPSAKGKILPVAQIKPIVPAPKTNLPVAKPLPPLAPKPKNPIILPPLKIPEKILQVQPPQTAPVNILASNVFMMGQPESNNFNPGINLSKLPPKATQDATLAEIKRHIDPSRLNLPPVSPVKMPPLGAAAGLDSLDSAAQFNIKTLQNYSLDSIVAKIKLLIKQVGYFDVIFNIEKSPAYKTYIQTGLKLLSDKQDFEQLSAKAGMEEYLTRDQFEKFTDLLAKIQTS